MKPTKWLGENAREYEYEGFFDTTDHFIDCIDSHPSGRDLCSAPEENINEVKDLMKCKRFAYEDDYTQGDGNVTCAHCHGLGFSGVCERHINVKVLKALSEAD